MGGLEHYMFSVGCRYFFEIAGNLFESSIFAKYNKTQRHALGFGILCRWEDSNLRPPLYECGATNQLSYTDR